MISARVHSTNLVGAGNVATDRVRGEIHISAAGDESGSIVNLIEDIYRQADELANSVLARHAIQEAQVELRFPTLSAVNVVAHFVPEDALDGKEAPVAHVLEDAADSIRRLVSVKDLGLLRAERILHELVTNRDGVLWAIQKNKAGVRASLEVILLKLGD